MQPENFVSGDPKSMVCKLKKSIYGLKQASCQWYHKFDASILSQGFKRMYHKFDAFIWSQSFKRSDIDHYLYTKRAKDDKLILLALYVDDMLLAGKEKSTLDALKQQLNTTFSMKDLGDAEHILGMRIRRLRDQHTLYLSQEKYIEKVLDRFNKV